MEFLTLFKKHGISYAIYEFSLLSQKNVDNHMQFMAFFPFLQKRGLSYVISETFFTSLKTWTIICNLWYLFPFSKNMDYHMKFLKSLSLLRNVDYHVQFMVFVS